MLLKTLCFGASSSVLAITLIGPMVLYITITLKPCQVFFSVFFGPPFFSLIHRAVYRLRSMVLAFPCAANPSARCQREDRVHEQ